MNREELERIEAAAAIDDDLNDESMVPNPDLNQGPRSQVYPVRLPVARIEQIRKLAASRGEKPTAMIREWVLARLDQEIDTAPALAADRYTSPLQIDPPGCGCEECKSGEYVPLDQATSDQVYRMLNHEISNGTGYERRQFLTVCDGTGRIVRIIHPHKNDEFLDALRVNEWRIK